MIIGSPAQREYALGIIYRANKDKVCSYILSNSGSSDEAKDIYQETVIAFYENVKNDRFKGESAISTYLYSIARFKWLNQIKKNEIRSMHHKDYETDEFDRSPMAELIDKEGREGVLEVLDHLGEQCKSILIESIYHNCSMKEITENGNYSSEQIARNTKYKCLKKLRELIAERPALINKLRSYE